MRFDLQTEVGDIRGGSGFASAAALRSPGNFPRRERAWRAVAIRIDSAPISDCAFQAHRSRTPVAPICSALISVDNIRRLYQLTIRDLRKAAMAAEKPNEKKVTPRSTDFAAWYNDVILKAELADYSPVRGCIVFRPDGFAIWEALRDELDRRIKKTGARNAYFPFLFRRASLRKKRSTSKASRPGRGRNSRRRQAPRGAADRATDFGDHHKSHVRTVDPFTSRSADDGEPMVQRGAMGNAHALVFAHPGIPVAGRTYGARDPSRSGKRNANDAGSVSEFRRGVPLDSIDRREKERGGKISRRGRNLHHRRRDGRWARAAMRDLALPRAEFRQGFRDPFSRREATSCSTHGRPVGAFRRGCWAPSSWFMATIKVCGYRPRSHRYRR